MTRVKIQGSGASGEPRIESNSLFEGVRNGLSADGKLIAAPFYAESSFTFYRSDLFEEAVTFHRDLLVNFGPPGASSNGHNENRALFANGACAMWIDATG